MNKMFSEIVESVLCEGSVDRYIERLIRLSNPRMEEYFDKPLYELKNIMDNNMFAKHYYSLFPDLFSKMINSKLIDYLRVVFLTKFEIAHGSGPTQFLRGLARIGIGEINMLNNTDCGPKIEKLKKIVKYIIGNGLQIDGNFDNMTYSQLNHCIYADIGKKDTIEKEAVTVHTNNAYTIIPINNTEEAKKYKDYTGGGDGTQTWCVCSSQNYFDNYTQDGRRFYFCLKDGFENIQPFKTDAKKRPLDEYGLSMIAINIDKDGELDRVTTRWNHLYDGENNPALMNKAALENILGCDFDKTFVPYTKEEIEKRTKYDLDEFDEFEERFMNALGYEFSDIQTLKQTLGEDNVEFETIYNTTSTLNESLVSGYRIVKHNGKSNIFNFPERKFLFTTWMNFISRKFNYGWSITNDGTHMTYLNLKGEILPVKANQINAFNMAWWAENGIKSNISILELDDDSAILLIADDNGNLQFRHFIKCIDIYKSGFAIFQNSNNPTEDNNTIIDCFGNEICQCNAFDTSFDMLRTVGHKCSCLFEKNRNYRFNKLIEVKSDEEPGFYTYIRRVLSPDLCEICKSSYNSTKKKTAIYDLTSKKYTTKFLENVVFGAKIKDISGIEVASNSLLFGLCPPDAEDMNPNVLNEYVPKFIISKNGFCSEKYKKIILGKSRIIVCTKYDGSTVIYNQDLEEMYNGDELLVATFNSNCDILQNKNGKYALANTKKITEFIYNDFMNAFLTSKSIFYLGIKDDNTKDLIGTYDCTTYLSIKQGISIIKDVLEASNLIYYVAVKRENGLWEIYPTVIEQGIVANNIVDFWRIINEEYLWVLHTTENKEQLFYIRNGMMTYPADEVFVNPDGEIVIRVGEYQAKYRSGTVEDFIDIFNQIMENKYKDSDDEDAVNVSLSEIKQMVKKVINEINKKRPW